MSSTNNDAGASPAAPAGVAGRRRALIKDVREHMPAEGDVRPWANSVRPPIGRNSPTPAAAFRSEGRAAHRWLRPCSKANSVISASMVLPDLAGTLHAVALDRAEGFVWAS